MPSSKLIEDTGRFVAESRSIGIIGVPFSKGQPRGGTDLGPKYLRNAGLVEKLKALGNTVTDRGDIKLEMVPDDIPTENVKNPRTVALASKKIAAEVSDILKSGKACLALGGDHSMAIGSILGHAREEPDLVVVWVDAHADINTPLSSDSGNIHGMPLSFLVKEIAHYVPKLPGFEDIKPCISARDIVYIGLRDVDPGERWIIEKYGIHAFSMQEVDKYGIKEVVERALKAVDPSGTRPVHVSFDVDALDPSLIPSTGTPVLGGLSLREGLYICEEMADTGRVSVVDIAEVNPLLGSEGDQKLTVQLSVEIIQRLFGGKRQGVYPPGYGIPVPS